MKPEFRDLIDKLRNEQKFKSNIDGLIWDYGFYTDMEKAAKKERERMLQAALVAGGNKPLVTGPVVSGEKLNIDLKIVETSKFDKEVFIDKILQHYGKKVDDFKLRELAVQSVVPSGERKEFKVVDKTVSF